MSDTPRTDALHFGYKDDIGMQRHELLKLSRTLERELVEAVAKERERCAKVCEERGSFNSMYAHHILTGAADAIRKGE